MKQIYAIVLGIISFIGLLPGCVDDPEMDTRLQNAKAPEVSETTLEGEIGASSITLTAQIIQENGLPVTECGVCWSVQEQTQPIDNMRSSRFVKADRIEGHTFAATMSNLEDSTRYYVYAYAINDVDTAFSETEKVYTTIEGIGEVVTLAIDSTEVNATSALVKGEIKNRGVGITEMGFYYQKKENETGVPELSEQDSIVRYTGDLVTVDTFSCRLTDLEPETWYYVRAFAKNQFGEFAFNVDSFRTTDGKPMVGNLRLIADSTTFTTADLSAYLLQEGDAEVSAYGFCWSEEEMPTMETDADTIICNNLTEDGRFVGRIQGLESAKKYFARAYAINAFGVTYSSEQVSISTKSEFPNIITFSITPDSIRSDGTVHVGGELQNGGNSNIDRWGICWSSTHREPTEEDNSITTTDTLFTLALSSLKGGTTYYVRAFAVNENNLVGYGTTQSFVTPDIFTDQTIYDGSNRQYSAAFTIGNSAYVVGGDLGNERSNELFNYNVTEDRWMGMTAMPHALSRMGTAVWNGQAYVVGGVDEQVSDAFQIYNAADNLWTEYPALSERRSEPVCFVYRDSLYVVGGSNSKGILRYDLSAESSGTWQTIADFPENQVGGVAFVVGENEVYVGLGRNNDNNMRTDFYYATDSLTHWEPISNTPESLESISSGVYDSEGNRFWMVDSSGKIWEYSLSDATWRARSLVPTRMKNYHMFQLDGIIYILGQDVWSKNKFFIYNPIWDN